jgi:hypothetical protein
MEFSFSQKFESLIVSFDALLLLLTRVISCDLDLYEGTISAYFFTHKPSASPNIFYFLRRGIMEPAPCVFGGLPPSLIMSLSVQFGFFLGMRLCGRRFGYLQEVVFMKNFWNLKAISKNHFDVCSKQNCSEKFKRFSWIGLHEY